MTGEFDAIDSDLTLKENRILISTMTVQLFDHWQLSLAEKLQLIGFNTPSRRRLKELREGRTA